MCSRVDVAKDRRDLLPLQRVGGCDGGKGWDDDLTSEPESPDIDLKINRCVAHGDTVSDTQERSDPAFQLLDVRARRLSASDGLAER